MIKERCFIVAFVLVSMAILCIAAENSSKMQISIQRYYDSQPHFSRGMGLFTEGKFREAASHFAEALKVFPEHAEATLYIGMCEYRMGEYEDALTRIEVGKLLYPAWHAAMFEIEQRKYQEAKEKKSALEASLDQWESIAPDYQGCVMFQPGREKMADIRKEIEELSHVENPVWSEPVIPAGYYFQSGCCLMKLY